MYSSVKVPIEFRDQFSKELNALESFLATLDALAIGISDEIGYGSRVLIISGPNEQLEGRVWGVNSTGSISVNRDGFKSVMNFERSNLKNLSNGAQGKLEQALWIANQRIQQLKMILEHSEIPEFLVENTVNIVKVIEVLTTPPMDVVTLIHAKNLESYKLKLPNGFVVANSYYQITVSNQEVNSIIKSDKEVFEKYYSNKN